MDKVKGMFSSNKKTFKPIKKITDEKKSKIADYAKSTLGSGNIKVAVQLPPGEDLNEWLAVNTVDFFNEISMFYGMLIEFCTQASCPVMCAGPAFEYLWADGVKVINPIKLSAPDYVDNLMSWVESQLNDENIFPLQQGHSFPKNFKSIVMVILKRLFRVYAHIYHSHMDKVKSLGGNVHLNTSFKHFIHFVNEFSLIDPKELEPMQLVIDKMMDKAKDDADKEEKDETEEKATTTTPTTPKDDKKKDNDNKNKSDDKKDDKNKKDDKTKKDDKNKK
jgi:MOB kinase activator 1